MEPAGVGRDRSSANIRSLGFRIEDVKLIVNSHVHFDHAGGIADLQRLKRCARSGQPVECGGDEKRRSGQGDPQYGTLTPIAAVKNVTRIARWREPSTSVGSRLRRI